MNQWIRQACAGAVVAAMTLFSGCGGGFFIDSTSTTSTSSSTGDYVYAVNPTTNSIYEYSLASAALTAISGSPVVATTGLAVQSVAVSRANTYVWVAGNGAISSYSIGSTGALTLVAAQAASATANFVSLETSPDGQWLLAMDSLTFTVYVFKINTSTGALGLTQTVTYVPAGTGSATPRMLRMSPTAGFVAAALGPGGDVVFSFNTSTGAISFVTALSIVSGFSDNAVQFDGTGANLYIARGATTTNASLVAAYTVGSTGALTTGLQIGSGNAPYAMVLESGGTYLYAVNRSDSTVSGYTVASTGLVTLSGSPYPSGSSPTALVEDRTHKYLVSAGSAGGADLTLYSLDVLTPGKLDAVATATSGASGITNLSATH